MLEKKPKVGIWIHHPPLPWTKTGIDPRSTPLAAVFVRRGPEDGSDPRELSGEAVDPVRHVPKKQNGILLNAS